MSTPLQGSNCLCHILRWDEQLKGRQERFPLQSCSIGTLRHRWTVHLHHQPEQSSTATEYNKQKCSNSHLLLLEASKLACTARHSTARHSTAQHGTLAFTTQDNAGDPDLLGGCGCRSRPLFERRHGTARHGTAQHITAQHSTAQHSTAQHSTAQQYKNAKRNMVMYCSMHV